MKARKELCPLVKSSSKALNLSSSLKNYHYPDFSFILSASLTLQSHPEYIVEADNFYYKTQSSITQLPNHINFRMDQFSLENRERIGYHFHWQPGIKTLI